ncbi:MAG TPA: hypothetical protein VFX16_06760 [Pseudonocardiaceae bacterium]|nr:hypothetical protein [Pseudonocardiaceae bacterium]
MTCTDAAVTRRTGVERAAALTTPVGVNRIAALTAVVALLVAVLFTLFALPARAAITAKHGSASTVGSSVGSSIGGSTADAGGSGVGTPQAPHPVASQPTGSSGAVLFGGLCLAGIVATAGGVLWYTVRTRRTLDSDGR